MKTITKFKVFAVVVAGIFAMGSSAQVPPPVKEFVVSEKVPPVKEVAGSVELPALIIEDNGKVLMFVGMKSADLPPLIPREPGIYPDPEDITKFYLITAESEGRLRISHYSCPEYTVFCPKELRCQVPELCKCHDKTISNYKKLKK